METIQSRVVNEDRQKKEGSHAEAAGIAEKARKTACYGHPGAAGSPERLSLAAFGQATGFRSQGTGTGFDSFTPYPLNPLPLAEDRI
jgi:hypothetical protein